MDYGSGRIRILPLKMIKCCTFFLNFSNLWNIIKIRIRSSEFMDPDLEGPLINSDPPDPDSRHWFKRLFFPFKCFERLEPIDKSSRFLSKIMSAKNKHICWKIKVQGQSNIDFPPSSRKSRQQTKMLCKNKCAQHCKHSEKFVLRDWDQFLVGIIL